MDPIGDNLTTRANATFVKRYIIRHTYEAWNATVQYADLSIVEHADQVWLADDTSLNVEPGTDANKWDAIPRPGYDFTGGVLRAMVRHRDDEAIAYVHIYSSTEGSDAHGIQINDMDGGDFQIVFEQEQLERMAPDTYVWDLVFERPDGLIDSLIAGTVTHTLGVTRDGETL